MEGVDESQSLIEQLAEQSDEFYAPVEVETAQGPDYRNF